MGNTIADGFERYIHWLVAWLSFIALNLLLEASLYLVEPPLRDTLALMAKWAVRGGSLCIVIAMILMLRLRRRMSGARRPAILDGYVVETIKRAASFSFFLTVVLIGTLDVIANDTPMATEFVLKLVGFWLIAVFVSAFVIMNWFTSTSSS